MIFDISHKVKTRGMKTFINIIATPFTVVIIGFLSVLTLVVMFIETIGEQVNNIVDRFRDE